MTYVQQVINRKAVSHLLETLHPSFGQAVDTMAKESPKDFFDLTGRSYIATLGSCGRLACDILPRLTSVPGPSKIQVWVLNVPLSKAEDFKCEESDLCFRYDVPIAHLLGRGKVLPYAIYNIRFNAHKDDSTCDVGLVSETSATPLSRGYIGITSRNPFTRFNEHLKKATAGQGHILHRTWNWLLRELPSEHHAVFQYIGGAKDLDEAYEIEERLVAANTLSPLGLNAIPGGYAGIRSLHKLALLSNLTKRPSIDERDSALEALEGPHRAGSPCAHYRRGHPRKLSSDRITWVNPCWVNIKEVEAA